MYESKKDEMVENASLKDGLVTREDIVGEILKDMDPRMRKNLQIKPMRSTERKKPLNKRNYSNPILNLEI